MAYSARNNQEASWQQLIIGIGDDAAAWRSDASTQLATIDFFIQDIHFSLSTTSWEDLG
jgi:thiamine monophosphate kinase